MPMHSFSFIMGMRDQSDLHGTDNSSCFSWLPSMVKFVENFGFHLRVKLGSDCVRRRALYKAVQRNNLEQAREILDQGLDLEKNTILLDCVTVRGYKELFKLLMQYYDVKHPLIRTRALDIAVWQGDIEITRMLIEAGVDYKGRNCDGETILYIAARGNSAPLVDMFVKLGCDINAKTNGQAPLHLATQKGHVETQRALLCNGCDVNLRDDQEGVSPLILAITKGQFECMHNLILAGCHVSISTLNENTAIQKQFRRYRKLEVMVKREMARVKSLAELCSMSVRHSLGPGLHRKVQRLTLPKILKDYIAFATVFEKSAFKDVTKKTSYRKQHNEVSATI